MRSVTILFLYVAVACSATGFNSVLESLRNSLHRMRNRPRNTPGSLGISKSLTCCFKRSCQPRYTEVVAENVDEHIDISDPLLYQERCLTNPLLSLRYLAEMGIETHWLLELVEEAKITYSLDVTFGLPAGNGNDKFRDICSLLRLLGTMSYSDLVMPLYNRLRTVEYMHQILLF